MEKDKRRKKVDDTKPDAEDVIDELLEGVDLKQGAPEEADSEYLDWIVFGSTSQVQLDLSVCIGGLSEVNLLDIDI